MTLSSLSGELTHDLNPQKWCFPSLYISKSDQEIESIVDALAGKATTTNRFSPDDGETEFVTNGDRRAAVRLCLQMLADLDGSFMIWLGENRALLSPRLHPRYARFLRDVGLTPSARKSRGQYRFLYELEAAFLSDMGFPAETIAGVLSELLALHRGRNSAKQDNFLRQVKSAISRRLNGLPTLAAASRVVSAHAGLRNGAAALAKALKE